MNSGSSSATPPVETEANLVYPDSHEALHLQVAGQLRVLASELGTGARLPSEAELVSRFEVSRTTVRRAVKALAEEGVLDVQHGRGSFVAVHAVTQSVDDFRPFVESLASEGDRKTELVDFGWRTGWDVPAAIGGPDLPGYGFRWLHRVDGRAHALFDCTLPLEIGQQVDADAIASTPVYYLLEGLGAVPHASDFSFTATGATADTARLLDVPEGRSLLILDRTTTDSEGSIIETSRYYLVPELHRVRLTASSSQLASVHDFAGPNSS